MKPPIYFNTTTGKSDLLGALQGSVQFAQTSVMPSRASAVPGDLQPRLVALRDALVMFKPTGNVDASNGLTLTLVRDKKVVFETQLNSPEYLPPVTHQLAVDEAALSMPTRFDYTVNTQSELNLIANDPDAKHLSTLLSRYMTINIQLGDGQWSEHFHLPEHVQLFNGRKILFQSNAGYRAQIHTLWTIQSLERGESLLYACVQGRWASTPDIDYARLRYGAGFWSALLPGQYLLPGLSLQIASRADNAAGSYPDIDIGASSELLLNVIDIGMLTPPRPVFFEEFEQELHRQYFQQTPISRLVVNQYEPLHLTEICLPDGTLYRTHSTDVGGVYDGDLRQRIGKELISLGINNANCGIHSSPGVGEDSPNKHYVVGQLTAHTSVGNYSNGRVVHGLSGGGSMVTLYDCQGNEFSHELGHNYGIDHYPGGFAGSVHRSAENINSTWGWDSDYNVFIPNFERARTHVATCEDGKCQAPFHGHSFGRDTMAGGYPLYPKTNAYTLCTPHTLYHSQRFLEDKAVFDRSSPTGYVKWHEESRLMHHWGEFHSTGAHERNLSSMTALFKVYRLLEVFQHNDDYARNVYLPAASAANRGKGVYITHQATEAATLHINGASVPLVMTTFLRYESDGQRWNQVDDFSFPVLRRPMGQGVPVTTLLGYYDPEHEKGAYVYPALHCAHGNWFDPDRRADVDWAKNRLKVRDAWGYTVGYVLANKRGAPGMMNRFHVNIPRTFNPTHIEIHLGDQVITREIGTPRGGATFTITERR